MIIICPCGEKKFEVDGNLIPEKGRTLQCGFCDQKWFFKFSEKKEKSDENTSVEITPQKEAKRKIKKQKEYLDTRKDLDLDKKHYELTTYKEKSNFTFGKLLSYIIVFIISFIAMIILIDTFKMPLYRIFPNLEIIIFSFFEILKDIKLFIIDLF